MMKHGEWTKMQLLKSIEQYAQNSGESIAAIVDDDIITYQSLWEESKKIADDFKLLENKTTVAIRISNPLTFIKYYIATLINNQIPCVLDATMDFEKINQLIKKYQINYMVDKHLNVLKCNDSKTTNVYEEELLHIGFTSGTTGIPKAYKRNFKSWLYSFEQNETLFDSTQDYLVAPGSHAHSLTLYVMLYALMEGKTFVGQEQFDIKNLSIQLNELKGNQTLFVVPTMLHTLLNHSLPLNSVKYIFSSGAKLSFDIYNDLKNKYKNIDVIEFFGSSEASFISYNKNGRASLHSVGTLFPGVEVKLKDADTKGIGKLYVKSDMTFSGYIGNQDNYDWIKIGDWAAIHNHNELYLYGREDDRMIIGGKNIFPQAIEEKLMHMNDINEVIIVSENHKKFGEIAVMLYTSNKKITYASVKHYLLSQGMNRYEIPSKMIRIDKMIYTSSRKIARKQMQERYSEGGIKWNQ